MLPPANRQGGTVEAFVTGEFYEDDEPVEDIEAIVARGEFLAAAVDGGEAS